MATKKASKSRAKTETVVTSDHAVIDTKPKKSKKGSDDEPRRFTPASFKRRSLRRKAERHVARTPLPNVFSLLGQALGILRRNWEIFGGMLLIYSVINLVLVGGLANADGLQNVKDNIGELFSGNINSFTTGLGIFSFLIYSGTGVANGASQMIQTILLIIFSLAFVWALRQLYSSNKIRIRDALYNSSYPLVPLLLVMLMICIHLVPAVVGSFLYSQLVVGELLTVGWHQVLASILAFMLVAWTFYLLCHSLIAAYVVTLPEMTPLAALRSAKEIVRYRRGAVLRKILFLPVFLLTVSAIIMVPLAAFFTAGATAVYFLLTMAAIPVVHAYMYTLYRELIK